MCFCPYVSELSDSVLKLNHGFWIIYVILSVPLVSNWRVKKDDRTFTKPRLKILIFSSFMYQITDSKAWFTFKVYPEFIASEGFLKVYIFGVFLYDGLDSFRHINRWLQ